MEKTLAMIQFKLEEETIKKIPAAWHGLAPQS
jgi:fructose-1,6-bisphosphatase